MRAMRRLIIAVLVLACLFVAADRVTVHIAEGQAASKIQSSRNLAQKPDVTIEGFPFLAQLVSSKLDGVKVHAANMIVNDGKGGPNVRLQDFRADLKGVSVSSNYSSAVADTATGTALISYADLSAALPNHVTVAYGGSDGKVKVSGKVDLPILGSQDVSGTADVSVVNGGISLTNLSGVTGVDPAVSDLVSSFLQPKLQLAGLPTGLKLDQVQPQQNGISLTVSGTNVSLNG